MSTWEILFTGSESNAIGSETQSKSNHLTDDGKYIWK